MRPIYVGKLSEKETKTLEKGLHSSSAFTVRRCQILLKSAKGEKAKEIAQQLHSSDQAVRNTIRAYQQQGLACLQEKSHARHDQQAAVDEQGSARLKEIVRLSPRSFDYETSVWTRPLLAKVLHQERVHQQRGQCEYHLGNLTTYRHQLARGQEMGSQS